MASMLCNYMTLMSKNEHCLPQAQAFLSSGRRNCVPPLRACGRGGRLS